MGTLIALTGEGPLHRRLYDSVRAAILRGRLPAGARLPSSRALAEQLRISRTPVLEAYAQLRAEGYVRGVTGSGTYVADVAPDRLIESGRRSAQRRPSIRVGSSPPLSSAATALLHEDWRAVDLPSARHGVSFRVGQVAREDFPHRLWRRLLGHELRRMEYGYGPVEGHGPLRSAVARHLAEARAIECEVEDVFIVAGARRALDLVTRLTLDAGNLVAMEEPHYPGARRAFELAGGRLVPIVVDEMGLDVAQLAHLPTGVRFVYVTPSHQFPTGGVLPLARRLKLLAWAEASGAMIVEDDYDAEFQFAVRPVEALRGLDRADRVIYIGTFAKVLSPDLRLGYVVVPPTLREPMRRLLWITDRQCPVMLQGALAAFFELGHYQRHVRRVRRRLAARREVLLHELRRSLPGRIRVQGSAAGVHVLIWIDGLKARHLGDLVTEGLRRGIELDPVSRMYLGEAPGAGLVLGYGGLREREIREGVQRLADSIHAVLSRA